jgi:hypothetical protein
MGFFKKIFKPVRKIAKKIIPKELKPFLPYLAASFGPAGLASSGIFSNPALTKAIIAGTTAAATDEDANILRTAMLAGAPDALSQGLGKFSQTYGAVGDSADKFNMLTKAADYAGKGKQMIDNAGLLKTVGAQGGIDMSIKAAELNQKKIDEYNANLLSQGIKDKGARRSAIFDIFINAGHDSEDVNVMLDKYGYADGGRIGFKSGDYVGSSNNETMKDEYDSYIKEIEIDGDKPMSFSSFKKMLSEDYADGGRAGYRYGKSVKKKKTSIKKKAPPSAGITTIEVDAEIDKDGDKDQMSMEEFVEMMKGGEDEGMSLGDSLDYAKQGLGMLQGDVAPVPIMRFADGGFGGITEAVESVREKAVGRDDYNFMDLIDEEGEEKYYQEREDKINDLLEQGYSFEEVREMLNMRVPGMKEGGRTKKKKKKYKYKRDGMEFDKPLGPDGTFNTGNPPKRYEVAEGGMMSVLPKNKEMDYRQGGMIPMGSKERADDVPARLSKNEFVMTADAVRAAGGGSINKGAKRMYNLMNNLEARV